MWKTEFKIRELEKPETRGVGEHHRLPAVIPECSDEAIFQPSWRWLLLAEEALVTEVVEEAKETLLEAEAKAEASGA